jgi:outer membrane protein assembly factor BamE (lipoprotein component of BamABCDE complex)
MRKTIYTALALCSLLLTGCVTTAIVASTTSALNTGGDAGTAVDQAQIDQFRVGLTTVADVKTKLGEPQQSAQKPDGGTTLTYLHRTRTSDTTSYLPVARWAGGQATIKTTAVVFDFDSAGKLLGSNKNESSSNCQLGKCPDLPNLSAAKP